MYHIQRNYQLKKVTCELLLSTVISYVIEVVYTVPHTRVRDYYPELTHTPIALKIDTRVFCDVVL